MNEKVFNAYDFDGTLLKVDSVKLAYKIMKSWSWRFFYYTPYLSQFVRTGATVESLRRKRISYWLKTCELASKLSACSSDIWYEDIDKMVDTGSRNIIISASYKELIMALLKNSKQYESVLAVSAHGHEPRYDYEKKVEIFVKFYPDSVIMNAYGDTLSDIPLLRFAKNGFLRQAGVFYKV